MGEYSGKEGCKLRVMMSRLRLAQLDQDIQVDQEMGDGGELAIARREKMQGGGSGGRTLGTTLEYCL